MTKTDKKNLLNEQKRDYLPINETQKTWQVASVYEISGVNTQLARLIYESDSLKSVLSVKDGEEVNEILDPAYIAYKLLSENVYDANLYRDGECVRYSELYKNPRWLELLENYYKKRSHITKSCIIDVMK